LSIQKKIAKNTVYNFLVKAIALFFGFIASVVVARFLGPEKYGIYSFVIWVLSTIALLANLGIPTTVTKYVSEYWGKNDIPTIGAILSRLFKVKLLAGILVGLLLFFFAPLISRWYHNPDLTLYLRVAAFVIPPLGLMWFYNGLFCGLQRFDLIAKINLMVSPVTVMVFLLIIYFKGAIEHLVAVSVVANVFLVASYLYYKRTKFSFIRKGTSKYDFKGKLLKFSAGAFVVMLLEAIIWERFGIFFLSIFSTPAEIAFYNVAFILSSRTMILLPGALTGILLPAMSEVYGAGNKDELARVHVNSTRYLAMLSIPLCLGGIAIAHQMFPVLYGSSFQPAAFVFAVLILGGVVGSVATSSSSLLYGAELQSIVVKAGIFSALINVSASLLLVPILGAKGAALAGASAQIIGGVVMIFYAYRKFMKQKFPLSNILRILLASALMAIAAFVVIETIRGPAGLILTLIVSFPLYILGLLLTHSLTPEDIRLTEAALGRLPESWSRSIMPLFRWLIKSFYPNR
jgi:O-antigen/teichoic acid export membrane protein